MNLFDMTGRVGVVTGAAQGMGKAMATAWAEAGADVVIVDRNAEGLEATAADIRSLGRRAVRFTCDLADLAQIDLLWAKVDAEFGRVDCVGNVAGDARAGAPETASIEDLQFTLQCLVVSKFYMCQHAGKRMLAQGKGSIINIGSLASVSALGRGHAFYSMGMGAVVQMTRELSTEWASGGVRVNAILPAQVVNPGLQERMDTDPNLAGRFLSGIPAGRLGTPSDIKGLSIFLASDASPWITGAIIPMDGGNLAMNGGGSVRPPAKRHD